MGVNGDSVAKEGRKYRLNGVSLIKKSAPSRLLPFLVLPTYHFRPVIPYLSPVLPELISKLCLSQLNEKQIN